MSARDKVHARLAKMTTNGRCWLFAADAPNGMHSPLCDDLTELVTAETRNRFPVGRTCLRCGTRFSRHMQAPPWAMKDGSCIGFEPTARRSAAPPAGTRGR